MATARLGTAPKIAWGFPFLVCREQGSSMGARTRPPLFTTRGGGGGGGKESREPGEKPRTVAKPGFPGAPHLVSKGPEKKVSSSKKARSAWGLAEATSCLGMRLGQRIHT